MEQVFAIQNGGVRLGLDGGAAVVFLKNFQTGAEWISAEGASPIFEIHLGDPAKPEPQKVLHSGEFGLRAVETSENAVVLAGECAGVYVGMSVSLMDTGLSEWWLSVLNRGETEITEVLFPIVSGMKPPAEGCGFTIPANNGWWLPYDKLGDDETLTWNYPIFGSMQWIDLGGKEGGLYIGCHDEHPLLKIMTAGKVNGFGHAAYRFTDTRILPGESRAFPAVVIGLHEGDWRTGARIYREWAETWIERAEVPEWVLRKPHWAWMGVKGQHAKKPERTYDDLPRQSGIAAEQGIEVLQVGGWLEHGHDAHYPDYVAGDSLGGEEGLTRVVREIHASGNRIALYTNGRIADPESSLKETEGRWLSWPVHGLDPEHVARMEKLHANYDVPVPRGESWDSDGTIAKEFYGIDFAVMCPSCREWRELFIERIAYLARTYEVDGVYLDQVCGCWGLPCYSETHDHAKPNEAWGGYIALLTELRRRLKEINPEIYIATEGVGDAFGQYFDLQQGHNDWDTQVGNKTLPMPELFRYTFPWMVVCTGPVYDHRPDLLRLAHLVGSGYDFCTMPPDRATPEILAKSKRVLEWRERYWREMALGEFEGPCETSDPDYRAFVFRGEKRTVVTLAWHPVKSELPSEHPSSVTVYIPWEGDPMKAMLLTEDAEVEHSAEVEDGVLRVTIPFAEIGMLVL